MAESLDCIFKPRSIAVIGASTKRGTIGHAVLHNLVVHEFAGKLFPVNPKAPVVHSIKCYPDVMSIPDEIDLAMVIVPRDAVLGVVEECGKKGVKGLVIISAGFGEVGERGRDFERRLTDMVRRNGMRMIGPNCMGVVNTAPNVSMSATFASAFPGDGKVAYLSQSGALGQIVLELARDMGLGLSMFASLGNKADVSANDILEYWDGDDRTKVILLYIESFGNPRRFTKLARKISRVKPIIAVKSGRTTAGARAVSSHTGSLAGLDVAADALFDQCGVLRVSTVQELFDLAVVFANQPLPKGNRVAVVTNAGGPGVLFVDAAVSLGIDIAQLSDQTKATLRKHVPAEASVENPVDLIGSATPERFKVAVEAVLKDPNVDSVVAMFVPPLMIETRAVARAVAEAATGATKPVLACFMGTEESRSEFNKMRENPIPVFSFPETTAKALAGMKKYRRLIERPEGQIRQFTCETAVLESIVARARNAGRDMLTDMEVRQALQCVGIPVAKSMMAGTMESVVQAAEEIGFPVVLKINIPGISHKTDLGGVTLDIRNNEELIKHYMRLARIVEKHGSKGAPDCFIVQEMVRGGKEVILGMSFDPSFGPLIMFGSGGIYVEAIKDVVFRISPITDLDAQEMIEQIRAYPLLRGVRGEPPVDFDTLVEILLRVSWLVTNLHEIGELDINPFMICEKGKPSKAVDARIKLAPR
ncbi:MAG: acetate--CoA ligase family protein [Planctomycetota bacterium]|nr:acetate--CoA ligase family protein [Planctomycetota bacterium]